MSGGHERTGAPCPSVIDGAMTVVPLRAIPEVHAGDDLAAVLLAAVDATGLGWASTDVLVVSSKILSKAQGLRIPTTERDRHIAERTVAVIAERQTDHGRTQIGRSLDGTVHVAAGVDASNRGTHPDLLCLPEDAQAAAAELRAALLRAGAPPPVAVIVSDTVGRPWRLGHTDIALGVAGMEPYDDLRGQCDADGHPLTVTLRALADELAAAAEVVKGKAEAVPAALIKGARWVPQDGDTVTAHYRQGATDWFRLGSYEAIRSVLGIQPGTEAAHAIGLPHVSGREPLAIRVDRAVRAALHAAAATPLTASAAIETRHVPELALNCRSAHPQGAGALAVLAAVAATAEGFHTSLETGDCPTQCLVRLQDRLAPAGPP